MLLAVNIADRYDDPTTMVLSLHRVWLVQDTLGTEKVSSRISNKSCPFFWFVGVFVLICMHFTSPMQSSVPILKSLQGFFF